MTDKLRAAAQMALDALQDCEHGQQYVIDAIIALSEALAETARKEIDPDSRTISYQSTATQEPVARLHDYGYWTPTKTEAGRAFNERMMRAGSPSVEVYTHPAPQPAPVAQGDAQPMQPSDDDVICPSCSHQFRAIPVNVQKLMLDAGIAPPFTSSAQKDVAMDTFQKNGIAWAVDRWKSEVMNRPMRNLHRRSLDDAWRQVVRYFGGCPDTLLGPCHDASRAQAKEGGE